MGMIPGLIFKPSSGISFEPDNDVHQIVILKNEKEIERIDFHKVNHADIEDIVDEGKIKYTGCEIMYLGCCDNIVFINEKGISKLRKYGEVSQT